MSAPDDDPETFEGWAILELMGHRKLAGFVRPVQLAGAPLIRIDVHDAQGAVATQFYAPAALYCLTPTTEEIAKRMAASARPEPVTRYELPAAREDDPDDGDDDRPY